MPFTTFDKDVSCELSPEKLHATAASVSSSVDAEHGRISSDPFVTNHNPGAISAAPSNRNSSSSPSQYNPPPTNAAIDLVIANAMANAPAQVPNFHTVDPHARIGNEITRVRTPSAINNLFPAAVGIDGRVNLFVGNLPYRVRWQDLKDLFRRAGTVLRADVSLGQDNRSRGYGTVLMGSREDGAKAIDMFNGYNWQTRTLEVRPDRLPPEYEPQVGQAQHPPFHNIHHPMNNQHHGPMFSNFSNPMNGPGHHIQQQPQFFRPPVALHGAGFGSNGSGVGTPMGAPPMIGHSPANLPFQHLPPLQKGLSPMPTGAVPQPQPFTGRPASQPQFGVPVFPPGQPFGSTARVGSYSSMTSANETRRELSPGLPEPLAMNRTASLSPHSVTPAPPGAIGEKLPSGPASSSGSVSGGSSSRAPPPVGLGPLPPSVLSNATSLPSPESLSPDTAGSNERPFGALGNGGMSRPPVGHHMGQTTGRVLFIGNLPFQCQWQDLKDLLRPAGNIMRADVALGPDNRSRGYGTVLFANESDAQNAVRMFNGFEYNGRAIKVYIDRNNDRHNSAPNQPPPRNQFQPYPSQLFYEQQQRPFAQPGPGSSAPWHMPVSEPQYFGAQTAQNSLSDNATRKSPILPLKLDTSISSPTDAQPAVSQSKPSGGKHPHPGPIAMPSFPNFTNENPLSPLQTRGLPPMTPSMPGFVFNAHPQTPPLHPHFLSPGFAPFSPGAPVTSPTMYQYNPLMNAAPGAPVMQNGAQGGTGVPSGRWNGYTAGLRTPQGNASSNGDYFPVLPKLDTSVSTASSSAAASPLNAKQQRFVSLTAAPAAAQGSPDLDKGGDLLSSAIQTLSVNAGTSPEAKLRGGRSSIDFTKPGSLSAAWNEAPGERRASWDVATKEQDA